MVQSPHDALFKATFSKLRHARPMLRRALPQALSAAARWSTLTLKPGSFVDEELKQRHSDLLFSVQLRSRPALLYVLFEHQSAVDRWMPLRLLEYMLRVWRAHLSGTPAARSLPPVVPIVLHHSEHGWRAATWFQDLFEIEKDLKEDLQDFVPRFRFVLDDVSRATDDDLRVRAVTALVKLVLGCLRHARSLSGILQKPDAWETTLKEIAAATHGVHALRAVLRYMFHVSDSLDVGQVRRFFGRAGNPALTEEIVTLAEHLREQGHRAGLKKGLTEGRAGLLLTLLRAKFGKVSARVVARVNAADETTLDRWATRMLTASKITEVFDG